jgi:predicted RNase H-like HicB family nuclease
MEKKKFVYYEEAKMLVGWIEEFPDYRTQGETLEELQENLKDIYTELTGGSIPAVHRIGELVVE